MSKKNKSQKTNKQEKLADNQGAGRFDDANINIPHSSKKEALGPTTNR